MLPTFLVNDSVHREDSSSPEIPLGEAAGKPLLVTLGITRIIEQESLDVTVLGSPDNQTWTAIGTFPQKFYCGTYAVVLDLSQHPDTRFLKVQWKMGRWGRGEPKPLFGFYVFLKEATAQVVAAR